VLRLPYRQSNPTRSHDAQELAMREDGNIPLQCSQPGNHPICTFGNLGGRFTARAPVSKEIPFGLLLASIQRQFSLVVAVVPLRQVRFNFRNPNPANSHVRRALQRTGEYAAEPHLAEPLCQPAGVLLALLVQRNIRSTRMLARARPSHSAVSNQVKAREHTWRAGHFFVPHCQFRISGRSSPCLRM
jgi:hypothetical protein